MQAECGSESPSNVLRIYIELIKWIELFKQFPITYRRQADITTYNSLSYLLYIFNLQSNKLVKLIILLYQILSIHTSHAFY